MSLTDPIIDATAAWFYVEPSAVRDENRNTAKVSHARQVAMWMCRDLLDMTYPELGELFGRDHTTIIHGVRQVDGQMAADEGFADEVTKLRMQLIRAIPLPNLADDLVRFLEQEREVLAGLIQTAAARTEEINTEIVNIRETLR
jgi:hypothetical protein